MERLVELDERTLEQFAATMRRALVFPGPASVW